MTTATQTPGQSFLRRRGTRVAIGAASVAGFTLIGASPAFAATDADCAPANTVDAGAGGTAADIQVLLDASTSVICLSGTFDVNTTLQFDYDVTIYGLSNAVLDGGDDTQILVADDSESITVQNLTLQNGFVEGDGAAINAYGVICIDSRFIGNVADGDGGAIYAYGVESYRSTFEDNDGDFGGAVLAQYGVYAEDSTFTSNTANAFGGAILGYGTAEVVSSTFDGNFSEESGGAILAENELSVTNSTFVGNQSGSDGGAIVSGAGTILQSTFLNNVAVEGDGNSVYGWDEQTDVRGNIFAGEGSEAQVGGDDDSTIVDGGGNIFSTTQATEAKLTGVQPSTGFALSSALIFDGATLADNGGPTQTVALYAGSPAVDAVPAGSPSVTVDQRGVARDALSDAGAYEFVAALAPDQPALAATGSTPAGWVAGAAGILLAAGAVALGAVRRRRA